MRRVLSVVLIALAASMAFVSTTPTISVSGGVVYIQSDSLGGNCGDLDLTPGVHSIYIMHYSTGTSGVCFRLETTPGMTWTYVSEVHYAPTLGGDLQSGITFCYGGCVPDMMLAKVTYIGYGTASECSEIRVAPYPGEDTIDELMCDGTVTWAYGGIFWVNNLYGCSEPVCDWGFYSGSVTPYNFCAPVGTLPTTWGAIKSLYQ